MKKLHQFNRFSGSKDNTKLRVGATQSVRAWYIAGYRGQKTPLRNVLNNANHTCRFFTVRRSRFLIGAAWFFSFLFSIPMLFLYEQDRINGYLQCWLSFPSQIYWQLYFTIVSILLFIIPVILIIVCFGIVLRTIWVRGRNLQFGESMSLSRQDSFECSERVGSVLYRSKRLTAG